MDEFTSLSTGCFVVKPSRRREKTLEFPPLFTEETKASLLDRYQKYTSTKHIFDGAVETVLKEINNNTVDNVVDFIRRGIKTQQNLGIQTLTLKIGVNFQEFSPIYDHASGMLLQSLNIRCVILRPVHNTEITALMKDVFNQILKFENDVDKVLVKTLSMKGLFEQVIEKEMCRGIVFFIPRFDILPSATMDKLIEICSSRTKCFQIFFVLGLSTGTELSSEWMSSSTLSQLKVETLTLPTPTSLLEKVLFQSLLSLETPFKLSYRAFEVLLSRFSFASYSLHDVMKTVKIALLNHSFQQPLFQHIQSESGQMVLDTDSMSSKEKALILQLPSVQKYVEKVVVSNKSVALELLQGGATAITKLFQECNENYQVLFFSFKVLHSLIKHIPGNNLVNKPLELYSFCIQGNVNEVKEVCVALKCFGMLQSESFLERLKTASMECKSLENPPTKIKLLVKVLEMQIEEMESIMSNSTKDNANDKKDDAKSTRERLKKLQTSFISRLENYFSTLTAPTEWPMHEVVWYTNHIELQNLLVGKCRTALHRGLTSPNLYLQGSDKTSKPDLCHLYELFLEHGRLISLHDWIQSFKTLLGKKKLTNETHAQFIRAVSELHFMGYLKPTKRKTDHVAKLSLLGY